MSAEKTTRVRMPIGLRLADPEAFKFRTGTDASVFFELIKMLPDHNISIAVSKGNAIRKLVAMLQIPDISVKNCIRRLCYNKWIKNVGPSEFFVNPRVAFRGDDESYADALKLWDESPADRWGEVPAGWNDVKVADPNGKKRGRKKGEGTGPRTPKN